MPQSRPDCFLAGVVVATAGFVVIAALPQSAAASSIPPADCVLNCTAMFDTGGSTLSFTVPQRISTLNATVAGPAGAPASVAITNDPTGVGGPGGASVVALGASHGGATLHFGIGAQGQGSTLFDEANALLAIAGGGGGGGYAAYFAWADQILANYPGGAGASPVTAGVTPGEDGAAFGAQAFNGKGSGAAGIGTVPGATGAASIPVLAPFIPLPAGGAGGSLAVDGITHVGGAGGTGYGGGGGGAIQRNVPAGDVDVDVVAPGGGGAGFLAAGLSASAGTPNTGSGYVSFTWSYNPAVSTPAPSTAKPGATIPVSVSGLPTATAFRVVFNGVTVASGTTDGQGIAVASFSIPVGQAAGDFPWTLVVGDVVVASSDAITIPAAATTGNTLSETGAELSGVSLASGALLLLAGASFFAVAWRRRNALR